MTTKESIDRITNSLMDIIRQQTGLQADSDADDNIYTAIHNVINILVN